MSLIIWLPLNGGVNNYGSNAVQMTGINLTETRNKMGYGYNFNGTSGRVAATTELNLSFPLSVCAWVKGDKMSSTDTQQIISYNRATGGDSGHNIGIGMATGKLSIWHGGVRTAYNTPLLDGKWYHIAATVTASQYTLYLDGKLILQAAASHTSANSRWFTVGARCNSSTGGVGDARYYFQGNICDVRMYNHCLTNAEVEEIYQLKANEKYEDKSLLVWLPLNDNELKNQGLSHVVATSPSSILQSGGKLGSCVHLNGSSQYIQLSQAPFDSSIEEFSFACWMKLEQNSPTMCLFSNRNATSGAGITIFYGSGNFMFDTGVRWTVTPTTSIPLNTWVHVAFTFKRSTEKVLYINGVKDSITTSPGTPNTVANATFAFIGASQNSGTTVNSNYFKGSLNDVRIYNYQLSDAEVREIAQGLVLHYKMGHQDIKGNILQDGYHFTANNLALTRATVPETGLLQITPTSSGAYAKYKTGLEFSYANNKRYVVSFDAQEIESTNSSYTTDYIRFYYGFSLSSRQDAILGSSDYYTYRNIQLLGTGWQHYVAIFSVPTPLEIGDSAALTNGSILAFQFGRRANKKPLQVKNIKLEIDSETIIYDSSGFGNHGEALSEIVYETSTPRYQTCTHFETTSEKIRISNFPTSGFGDSYTFAWWSKINSINPMQWGFLDGRRLNGIYHAKWWNTGDGNQNPLYVPGTTTQVSDPTLNTWHHWAMTGDGTTCKVYQDGELWGVAKTYKAINGTEIFINGWDSTTDYSSNNLSISDFRIYCTALDADAIRQLYEIGVKIDNKQNLHTFELNEINSNIFAGKMWSSSYGSHTPLTSPFINYNLNGEPQFTTNGTSAGSEYIKITPGTYEYDYTISVNTGNQFYIGIERYDANKTSRSNAACVYTTAIKPTTDIVKQRYKGTVNLTTDGTNTIDTITLRILNGWSGTTSGVTGLATIHSFSLKLQSSGIDPSLKRTGQFIAGEFKEETNTKFYKDHIVEANEFIEL